MRRIIGITAALAVACSATLATAGPASTAARATLSPPECVKADNGTCLPIAPDEKRVDLDTPVFTNPLNVDNPLHPSAKVSQVIYGGHVGGKPFRTEFTLLSKPKVVRGVPCVALQYIAYSDGRIEEIAVDWFAQDDEGAVWYFGEDVSDFKDGVVHTHEGTWRAGRDGAPIAMIMPGNPKVGDVYRTENAPGIAFEEVTVLSVGETLKVSELHTDRKREIKVFKRGYGEYSTESTDRKDIEIASLAVPTDHREGKPDPAYMAAVKKTLRAVYGNDWGGASLGALRRAFTAVPGVPAVLQKQTEADIALLGKAVAKRKPRLAHQAALRLAQDELDLRLLHQSVPAVDRAKLGMWARQVTVDAADKNMGGVLGDIVVLGLIRDRVRHTLSTADAAFLDRGIRVLRKAAKAKDLAAVSRKGAALDHRF
ncbi:hypothetical protein OHA25_38155 [Nonomuraea sp. NBC_00507]|uniref:hypothetical protein n=1 Tax=Nonomuraea sp. NBC_00507 TaxID=2976002 RepID=UPI002E18C203